MLNWIKNLFRPKELKQLLNETKKVKIKGVVFHIKKADLMSYLDGSSTLLQSFMTYEQGKASDQAPQSIKKIKSHYSDVILAGTVKPQLTRKPPEEAGDDISIDEVFTDWDMASQLYTAILEYTYGKKKATIN